MDTAPDAHAVITSLVDLAVASDDPTRLVDAAGARLGCTLGLVDAGGEPLAWWPDDAAGERAVTIARAAARNSLVVPDGWKVFALARNGTRLGHLAAGGPVDGALLALLPPLLADQLRRGSLVGLQRAAFVRRLVSAPAPSAHRARQEAHELGVRLAQAYWPAIVTWRNGAVRPEVVEALEREARGRAERGLTALINSHLVLLHPTTAGGREGAAAWFDDVAALALALAPSSRARVIAGEEPAELDALAGQVAGLGVLARFGPRSEHDRPVTWAREYALDGLLSSQVEPDVAAAFVESHVGPLIAWDAEHRTNLLAVLEAELDFGRHEHAAQIVFMHRNTFRHRLAQATEVLGGPLGTPERRLAVHVAIKLHRVLCAEGEHPRPPQRRRGRRAGRHRSDAVGGPVPRRG